MSKKLIQDILVNNHGNIRMVKKDGTFPSSTRVVKNKSNSLVETEQKKNFSLVKQKKVESNESFYSEDDNLGKVSKNSVRFLWFISVVCIGVLFYFVVSNLSTATINITPRSEDISLDDTFVAVNKETNNSLPFEVMVLEKTLTKTMDRDTEDSLERKSVGKVMLYNNYSTTNQRLITNTRLEATNKLIYRIRNSVNIPGYKMENGKKIPGSVEAEIIADEAGDKYNLKSIDSKEDFKISGFKGSPKFDAFYAKLITDISGGYIGKVKKVSDDKLSKEKLDLDNSMREDLIKELYQKKPDEYEIFKDNYYFSFKTEPDVELNSDKYTLKEKAIIHAIMFKKDKLASFIAQNKLKDFQNDSVEIIFSDNAVVSVISSNPEPWTENSIKLKFVGDSKIVWSYDPDSLLGYIVGQNKTIINDLVNDKFKSSVKSISAIVRPQWKNTFPENKEKISIFDTIRAKEIIN